MPIAASILCASARNGCFARPPTSAGFCRAITSSRRNFRRAAFETLAIIAYHQPVTRAEIEDIRGVAISKGTIDVLLETGWVRLRGRRRTPGRPLTYGTNETFLLHFGLEQIADLPGLEELKGAGMFDGALPQGFAVPQPRDDNALTEDEDPLEGDAQEEFVELSVETAANEGQSDDEPEMAAMGPRMTETKKKIR